MRRAASRFADQLDTELDGRIDLLTQRSPQDEASRLDDPLRDDDAMDLDAEPLLSLAAALGAVGQAPPVLDPARRAMMRNRLVAVATVAPRDGELAPPAARRRTALRARRGFTVAALASAMGISALGGGVAVAASHSLPGDRLYGVKSAAERVQLWTSFGKTADGKRHLQFAATRLVEARQLLISHPGRVPADLAAMNAQTAAGQADLLAAYRSSHSSSTLQALTSFSTSQTKALAALWTSAPVAVRTAELSSYSTLSSLQNAVAAAGGTVATTPTVPSIVAPSPNSLTTPQPSGSSAASGNGAKTGTGSSSATSGGTGSQTQSGTTGGAGSSNGDKSGVGKTLEKLPSAVASAAGKGSGSVVKKHPTPTLPAIPSIPQLPLVPSAVTSALSGVLGNN